MNLNTVIDIGSNIGEFALSLLEVNPNLRIICIEADPTVLAALRANMAAYPRVDIAALAVGSVSGRTIFYSSWRDADSSLVKPTNRSTEVEVPVLRLDELLSHCGIEDVSLLKMDAEGSEPEVLSGAHKALARTSLVAIDAGPERYKQDTVEPVSEALHAAGFEVAPHHANQFVIFGTRVATA